MAKEVILMSVIEGLGAEGDVVRVADGYARNYLIPRKLAAPVTETTRRQLAKLQRDRAEREKSERTEAEAFAARLAEASCTIAVKTGEGGKLFGSVTAADVAASLKEQGIELDRHRVVMEAPLRELGVFNVPVKLSAGVEASVKVWVVEE